MEIRQTVFIVWKAYQRRVEAFKSYLNANAVYIHYNWEEKTKIHKVFSYLLKLFRTYYILLRQRPSLFYIQAPPTFLVYAAYIYSKILGAKYVVDAHNSMIYDSFWCRMPFARYVLAKSAVVIVHNDYVAELAKKWGIPYTVLICRPPEVNPRQYLFPQAIMGKRPSPRVVVPSSFDSDEPLEEIQKATLMLPNINFFITWYREKIPPQYVQGWGENVVFTGFLPEGDFDALLAHGDAILVLTTRDGTQPSGATEALAFEKPLIVSDFEIIRTLFPAGAIYVKNNATDIAEGIRMALERKNSLAEEMASFKGEKLLKWEQQFKTLTEKVAGLSVNLMGKY